MASTLFAEVAMISKDRKLDPQVVARLETLDDVIFPAIEGDPEALSQSEMLWKQTVADLGPAVVEESRREYLRYARTTWRILTGQAVQNPLQVLAVMKIIGLLMGEDA